MTDEITICLNCSLPFGCDETDRGCRLTQITRRRASARIGRTQATEEMKTAMINILARLIGMQAVDRAKANRH